MRSMYADLFLRINQILDDKGYSHKLLTEKLNKETSEIRKWLSGNHDLTLRSISKLESELGEKLVEVIKGKPEVVLLD